MNEQAENGQRIAALLAELAPLLERAEGQEGWLAALRFGVAGGLAQAGEGDLAEVGFRRLVTDTPHHLWCWIGLIDIARARGDAATAVAIGREALGHLPNEALLRRKTAEALETAEGPAAALGVMEAQADWTADDLAFAIGLHRAAGSVADAAEQCARLLALKPDHALAHLARIEIGLHAGDRQAAVAAAAEALAHHPDHAEIVLRAAQAHRDAGEGGRAADLAVQAPDDPAFAPWFLSLRADLAEESGALEKARALWSELHALALPEFTERAQAALVRLAVEPDAQGETEPAVDSEADTEAEAEVPPDDADAPALPTCAPDAATLFAQLDAALSEGAEAAEAVLRRLVARPDLPWYLAFRLVEHAWRSGPHALVARLSSAFDGAPWPDADGQAFAIEDRLMREGPRAALDWVRAHPVPRRDAEAAERLGRVLLGAGTGALAARYLSACFRRWPDDPSMLRLATDACIACGAPEKVVPLLDRAGAAAPSDQLLASRVSAALVAGDMAGAMAACRVAEASGHGQLPLINMIELHVLAGDLAAAEACVARLSIGDGPMEEAMICRPRATRVGSLLNEARILAAAGLDWMAADTPDLVGPACDFFLPARTLLQRLAPGAAQPVAPWGDRDKPTGGLHLVWPGPPPRPDQAAPIVAAWQGMSRRDVIAHEDRGAPAWLRDHIGADAARAHALAPEAEQKADLMLLGALLVEGGIALTGTQWPSDRIDQLADRVSGIGLFLDGTGAVSMDAVIAVSQHPVIVTAFEMAVASILSRENDHRWFKTGPGLLTRALVQYLADGAGAQAVHDVTLCPLNVLRALVHPLRVEQAPWLATRRRGARGSAFAAALSHLLAPDG